MRKAERMAIRNKPLNRIKWMFFILFGGLSFYILYWTIFLSDTLMVNEYNPRLGLIEASVKRGAIVDRNGEILASSELTENGYERKYPFDNLFVHTVGYVDHGKSGLEKKYDLALIRSGDNLFEKLMRELNGNIVIGNTLKTTLDVTLQEIARQGLGSYRGAVVAMDPQTGGILAMVSSPDFSANNVADIYDEIAVDDEEASLLNRGTQGLYPPGSTFKVVTSIAYLENHAPSDFYYFCEGQDIIGSKSIHCYGNQAHGWVDLEAAFALSCNTSFAKISTELSKTRLKEISEQFLLNAPIEFDLETKASRFVLGEESTSDEMVVTVIGQGETEMTPLNDLLIAAAVAGQGTVKAPHLIQGIYNEAGDEVFAYEVRDYATIMTPAMAKQIAAYMAKTSSEGTAKDLNSLSYPVASKTGTAETDDELDHAWYIGYAPLDNPQIAIAIIVENSGSGSKFAVPIAKSMYQAYLGD